MKVEYLVTHNETPSEPRSIGPYYEWGEANEWTQIMTERDALVFMQTSAVRELTFTPIDEYGNLLPPAYPLAADAPIPDGVLTCYIPTLTGPIRAVITDTINSPTIMKEN